MCKDSKDFRTVNLDFRNFIDLVRKPDSKWQF